MKLEKKNYFWCSCCCCCYYLIRGVVCLLACSPGDIFILAAKRKKNEKVGKNAGTSGGANWVKIVNSWFKGTAVQQRCSSWRDHHQLCLDQLVAAADGRVQKAFHGIQRILLGQQFQRRRRLLSWWLLVFIGTVAAAFPGNPLLGSHHQTEGRFQRGRTVVLGDPDAHVDAHAQVEQRADQAEHFFVFAKKRWNLKLEKLELFKVVAAEIKLNWITLFSWSVLMWACVCFLKANLSNFSRLFQVFYYYFL